MHKCLHIPEIVSLICQSLFNDFGVEGRKGLLALARTCRLLYAPAADVTWYRIPSLKPLVDCISQPSEGDVEGSNDINIPLRLEELPRCRELGARVRVFGRDAEPIPRGIEVETLTDAQYETLQVAMMGATLLPNVTTINLVQPTRSDLTFAPLFTHNQIKSLTVYVTANERTSAYLAHLVTFLNRLDQRFPCLSYLDLDFEENPPPNLGEMIEKAMHRSVWKNLTTLFLRTSCSLNIISEIYKYPSLKELIVETGAQDTLTKLDFHPVNKASLPDLQLFRLDISCMDAACSILDLFTERCPMHTLEFGFFRPQIPYSERWSTLTCRIRDRCLPSTLRKLFIDDTCDEVDEELLSHSPFIVASKQLSPLFIFFNLLDVVIQTFGDLILDDNLATQVVGAWPKLRRLRLTCQREPNELPRLSPLGLTLFADRLCDLEKLTIEFNSEFLATSNPGSRPRFGRKLRELNVVGSPIAEHNSRTMPAFLADLFPGLKRLTWAHPVDSDEDNRWKIVESFLPIFIQTRSDEASRFAEQFVVESKGSS